MMIESPELTPYKHNKKNVSINKMALSKITFRSAKYEESNSNKKLAIAERDQRCI